MNSITLTKYQYHETVILKEICSAEWNIHLPAIVRTSVLDSMKTPILVVHGKAEELEPHIYQRVSVPAATFVANESNQLNPYNHLARGISTMKDEVEATLELVGSLEIAGDAEHSQIQRTSIELIELELPGYLGIPSGFIEKSGRRSI